MPAFRRRPLAATLFCLFAMSRGWAYAGEAPPPAEQAPASAEGKRPELRLERRLRSLSPNLAAERSGEVPIFITAEQIEGSGDQDMLAEGAVEVRKAETSLYADRVHYQPLVDEVIAEGNVRLTQFADELRAPYLRMKLSRRIGHLIDAEYKIRREVARDVYQSVQAVGVVGSSTTVAQAPMLLNVPDSYGLKAELPLRRATEGHGQAARIDFEGENQIKLREATYSVCRPDQPDWLLKSDFLHLDYDAERAKGEDAVLYFKDLPVFYSPWLSFSLNQNRASGFLTPMFSASTRNGLDLTLPYYLNLAPHYDATLFPRVMAKRGTQLGAEFRYLDHSFNGTTKLEYLPEDKLTGEKRYAYHILHNQTLSGGFSAAVNFQRVSDDFYWSDLSSRLLETTQNQLPQQLSMSYQSGSWWSASMNWLRYQTLQTAPENPLARPYFLEPQLLVGGRYTDILGGDFILLGQLSRFTFTPKVNEVQKVVGQRAVLYPQFSLPFLTPAFSITPKFGLHMTQYDLQHQTAGAPASLTRVIPTFTLDSTVVFERDTSWLGRDFIQTLEPRLYYVHIPYRDQSKIPVFDSGLADFNFGQMFTENRYSGQDRINDANQLTAAVTTRLLDSETGAEYFRIMAGQRYYFSEQRVRLYDAEPERAKNFSNSLLAFTGLLAKKTYFDSALEYNQNTQRTERFSVGARYEPKAAQVFSASYRMARDGLGTRQIDQIDLATQWPLAGRWHAVGRYNYSLKDKQLLEAVAGAEYNAGCWAARFVVQRLEAIGGTPNTTFFFQLELNDFASIGSNPIQLLRRSIPGYGKSNELPTSGSLLTSE